MHRLVQVRETPTAHRIHTHGGGSGVNARCSCGWRTATLEDAHRQHEHHLARMLLELEAPATREGPHGRFRIQAGHVMPIDGGVCLLCIAENPPPPRSTP